jgi:hypothetical protein
LGWIDVPDRVTLSYDLGNGASIGRIDYAVFEIGWDGRYVVAKQHPRGDKAITNYFVVDVAADSANADPKLVVLGPYTADEFSSRTRDLKLPPFTKVLQSLK